ncbi:MAG: tetratricopeptide repeat protein [Vampirovibrionales bacterium]|nr:tetratricopeptide repeat protein [Vampirovibrionales bacterium]
MSHVTDISGSENQFSQLLEQGTRQYQGHQYDDALETFNTLEKMNPTASEVFLHKGNIYFQKQENEWARENFERAIQLDPMEGSAYLNLGKLFFKMEQYGMAAFYWEQAKALVKNNANLWLNLGIAYDKLYQPDRAMRAYSIYIGLQPGSMEAAKLQVRFEKSRKIFEHNIQIAEDILKKGDRAKAADIFRKELMSYPGSERVYKTYASLLYQKGDLTAALDLYLKAFDIRQREGYPLDGLVLTNLAVVYEKLGQPIDALWAYALMVNHKLKGFEQVMPHHERLQKQLLANAEQAIPAYLQESRGMLRHPMQAETGKRMATHAEALAAQFPGYQQEMHELADFAEELFNPSLKAAKTYFSMGNDARAQGKFDQALGFYQKFLILQAKGEKAKQAREYIKEIKQIMGAVVNAMITPA